MDIYFIEGIFFSAAIGITLGMMGGCGSIIAIPILLYLMDFEVYQAVNMSLAIVAAVSLVGAGLHNQHGTVKFKTGLLFSIIGMPGAYLGSRLRYLLSIETFILSFIILKIIIGILMLVVKIDGSKTVTIYKSGHKIKGLALDSVIGFLTGFLGVNGGFMIIPALVVFYGVSLRDAIGTSLFVVAVHCGTSLIGHIYLGSIDFHMTMFITMVAIDGVLLGTFLSYRISPMSLRKWFAVFVIAVAIFLMIKNYKILSLFADCAAKRKSEILSTKYETSKSVGLSFEHLNFEFRYCFVFRDSNLGFRCFNISTKSCRC